MSLESSLIKNKYMKYRHIIIEEGATNHNILNDDELVKCLVVKGYIVI